MSWSGTRAQPIVSRRASMRRVEASETELVGKFTAILHATPSLMRVLRVARGLDLPDWLVFSGAAYQPVLNHLTGRAPDYGVKDYDLAYFDGSDLSSEAEDAIIRLRCACGPILAEDGRFRPHLCECAPSLARTRCRSQGSHLTGQRYHHSPPHEAPMKGLTHHEHPPSRSEAPESAPRPRPEPSGSGASRTAAAAPG